MKKIIALIAIVITLTTSAQTKDSTAKDTVYVLSASDMNLIIGIIRINPIQVQGKQLSFDEQLQLLNYLYGKAQFVPKKSQPKK